MLVDMRQHGVQIIAVRQVSIDRRHLAKDAVKAMQIVMKRHIDPNKLRQSAPMVDQQIVPGRLVNPGVKGDLSLDGLGLIPVRTDRHQAFVPRIKVTEAFLGAIWPNQRERELFKPGAHGIKLFQIAL